MFLTRNEKMIEFRKIYKILVIFVSISFDLSKIKQSQLTKLYYSIGEVAEMFDVNASLIRFWEKEFSSIKLKKNKKGNRVFTSKDIIKIDKIYTLVKQKGYTLDGAKRALKDFNPSEEINTENLDLMISKLEAIKGKLLKMKT